MVNHTVSQQDFLNYKEWVESLSLPVHSRSTCSQDPSCLKESSTFTRVVNSHYFDNSDASVAEAFLKAYGVTPSLFFSEAHIEFVVPLNCSQAESPHVDVMEADEYQQLVCFEINDSWVDHLEDHEMVGVHFVKAYEDQVKEAAKILQSRHPEMRESTVTVALFSFMGSELPCMTPADVVQELAAVRFAHPDLEDEILKYLYEERSTYSVSEFLASTDLGDDLWMAYSDLREIPLQIQGYGPVQIIPELAFQAWQEIGPAYPGLTKDIFENADGSPNWQGIIKASYDPDLLFKIRTLCLDLQITTLKSDPRVNPETFDLPLLLLHLPPSQDAYELFLLSAGLQLTIFPDQAEVLKDGWDDIANTDFTSQIVRLYFTARLLGLPEPEFDHFAVIPESSLLDSDKQNCIAKFGINDETFFVVNR